MHALNRLQNAIETLRHALNTLAVVAPAWLREHAQPEWVERYEPRACDHPTPTGKPERQAHAEMIGADGNKLLTAIYESAPCWLCDVPAIETLRRVWVQQFYMDAGGLHWRTQEQGIPPARLIISSPYDLDARLGMKRTTQWIGYKVCVTESCDDDQPRLITNVETSSAPVSDGEITPQIHNALKAKELLPDTHIVDTGFVDSALLVASREDHAIDLLGPTRANYKWRSWIASKQRAAEFDGDCFHIDWEQKRAVCPEKGSGANRFTS